MVNLSENICNYIDKCQYMKGLSDKSIKAYRIDLNQFLNWHGCCYNWCSKNVIENYIKHLHEIYKPKSAKRKIASLKAFFHFLETEEIIGINPFHKIKFKRREVLTLPRTIPSSTVTKMLNKAYQLYESEEKSVVFRKNTLRDIVAIELMFATGVRVCELCTLTADDIDLKNKMIKVHGKGTKERFIQITNKNVQAIIKEYRRMFSTEIKQSGYFLVNNRGNRFSEQSARYMIDKYAKLVGSDIHITPHMFRHTIATLLLEEEVDIRYIQELLGHSSITTTQIYTHISLNAQKRIFTKKHPRNKLNINNN